MNYGHPLKFGTFIIRSVGGTVSDVDPDATAYG
jgi:hypothetical protein